MKIGSISLDLWDDLALEVVHAFQEVTGQEVPASDRAALRGLLRGDGEGHEATCECGRVLLDLARRGERVMIRYGIYEQQAARNDCVERERDRGIKWATLAKARFRRKAERLGRRGWPIDLFVVLVDEEGLAVQGRPPEFKISLDAPPT